MTDLSCLTATPIAHRGLHDLAAGRPENTLGAIQAAMNAGYSIECDLQLSKDNVPMVFHDAGLNRLTGVEGVVAERTADCLAGLRILQTGEHIPALRDMLDLVNGAVPLVIELKDNPGREKAFATAVVDALKGYGGNAALMSFSKPLMSALRETGTDWPLGLTAEGGWRQAIGHLRAMLSLDLEFMSYSVNDLATPAPWITRHLLRRPVICWTVRTDADRGRAARHSDQMTFEGFLP